MDLYRWLILNHKFLFRQPETPALKMRLGVDRLCLRRCVWSLSNVLTWWLFRKFFVENCDSKYNIILIGGRKLTLWNIFQNGNPKRDHLGTYVCLPWVVGEIACLMGWYFCTLFLLDERKLRFSSMSSVHWIQWTRYTHPMYPFLVSIQCVHSIYPFNVFIQCVHSMFTFNMSIQCAHSMCTFNVSIQCVQWINLTTIVSI